LRLILVGFGTVAQSLVRIISSDKARLVKDYGFEPIITAIVDSRGFCHDDKGLDLNLALKTKEKSGTVARYSTESRERTDVSRIISNSDAEVLVETTPSNFKDAEPGLTNIKKALSSGKHVVTTNKGPLALAMPALLELAAHRRVQLLFNGTVGAGTPFLSFASKCLPGEKITGIHGILNGTTNYILTRMEKASLSFQAALREAQAKGYAESDPANDVEGYDTAAKIVIMANWVLEKRTSLNDLEITGISKVTPQMLKKARASGSPIKLVGRISQSEAVVKPEPVSSTDPICVPDTLNALTFATEHAGDMTLIGHGAGGEQTASAIIRDLVDIRNQYAI
jgi:homoserine dehydrogenase